MKLSWQHIYISISMMTYKPSKLGQTDPVIGLWSQLSAGLCTQDDKSLYVAVTICATLVNTQTDQTDIIWSVILLAHPAVLKRLIKFKQKMLLLKCW